MVMVSLSVCTCSKSSSLAYPSLSFQSSDLSLSLLSKFQKLKVSNRRSTRTVSAVTSVYTDAARTGQREAQGQGQGQGQGQQRYYNREGQGQGQGQQRYSSNSSYGNRYNSDSRGRYNNDRSGFQRRNEDEDDEERREAELIDNEWMSNMNFSRGINVEIFVGDNEPIDSVIRRFQREVSREGIFEEVRRRRFKETTQEKKKRKKRALQRANSRRNKMRKFVNRSRGGQEDINDNDIDDETVDNWDVGNANYGF